MQQHGLQQQQSASVSIAQQQQQQLMMKANERQHEAQHDKSRVALLLEINTLLLNEVITMQEKHAPNFENAKSELVFREYASPPRRATEECN